MLVGGLDLDDLPPVPDERVDVPVPLRERELGVGRDAVQVRQLAGPRSAGRAVGR